MYCLEFYKWYSAINKPVCTLSPTCSSDIVTDFPFSRVTVATDGKHLQLQQLQTPGMKPPQYTWHRDGHWEKTFHNLVMEVLI